MGLPVHNFDSGRLSHAYIAAGEMADTIAAAVVCSERGAVRPCGRCACCLKASRGIHPDIAYISKAKDRREIAVEQIRELKRDVIVVPNDAMQKAYVIESADLMNDAAQNALLQILEEPPAHAVFVLRTDAPAQLLPTVRSRCVLIRGGREAGPGPVPESSAADSDPDNTAACFFGAIERGNLAIAEFMFRLENLEKRQFENFLPSARREAAARLRRQAYSNQDHDAAAAGKIMLAVRLLEKAGEHLELNVSTGHISGFICASLME